MNKVYLLFLILFPFALHAQSGSEIYLFDFFENNESIKISNPKNITNHKGYDNQPSFDSKRPIIYYASFDENGRSDIKQYNYQTGETVAFTKTPEREYSPLPTPDGQFISCIIQRDDGKQDLGKYPLKGGPPVILIGNLTVGYHAWINNNEVLIFVLGANNSNTLHLYHTETKEDTVIAKGAGRSLQHIPGQNAMSFVQKDSVSAWKIKRYDISAKTITDIIPALSGREDLAWTKDGTIIMSDGRKLYWYKPGKSVGWNEIISEKYDFMTGISRLAVDKMSHKLAVVVSE